MKIEEVNQAIEREEYNTPSTHTVNGHHLSENRTSPFRQPKYQELLKMLRGNDRLLYRLIRSKDIGKKLELNAKLNHEDSLLLGELIAELIQLVGNHGHKIAISEI